VSTPASSPAPELLSMRGISKRFAGVAALAEVSLTARAGEVLALMGENGAGKSTLMKILGGIERPDAGEIWIEGRQVHLGDVRAARRLGIALIHQELMLAPNLDIAANIFLGNEAAAGRAAKASMQAPAQARTMAPMQAPMRGQDQAQGHQDAAGSGPRGPRPAPVPRLLAPLPRAEMDRQAASLLARVGLDRSPGTSVGALTVGQRQLVEIARALSVAARIIVMDEPTSSLSAAESARLFEVIGQLRAAGVAIIYISHRMEEVQRLADRVTVLRDGRQVGDLPRHEATTDRIVALMVGRELSGAYFPAKRTTTSTKAPGETSAAEPAAAILEVDGLVVPGAPAGVSFELRRGEILGFAGLVGAGRTELVETIFGITPARAGTIKLAGRPFAPKRARDAISRGVCLAPEDRKRHGLVLPMTVAQNCSLPSVGSYNRWGWLDRRTERRVAETEVARLGIKTAGIDSQVLTLSGGNQQKVVLGKWLAMSPQILILDEPTRGIDVGARAEIYRQVAALAAAGVAILLVSSDMEEVIGLCDRVLVMRGRRVAGVLERAALSPERIGALMTGAAAAEIPA
jgi:ribose transport system ATP-binding protein